MAQGLALGWCSIDSGCWQLLLMASCLEVYLLLRLWTPHDDSPCVSRMDQCSWQWQLVTLTSWSTTSTHPYPIATRQACDPDCTNHWTSFSSNSDWSTGGHRTQAGQIRLFPGIYMQMLGRKKPSSYWVQSWMLWAADRPSFPLSIACQARQERREEFRELLSSDFGSCGVGSCHPSFSPVSCKTCYIPNRAK